jgi:hypothetical protein
MARVLPHNIMRDPLRSIATCGPVDVNLECEYFDYAIKGNGAMIPADYGLHYPETGKYIKICDEYAKKTLIFDVMAIDGAVKKELFKKKMIYMHTCFKLKSAPMKIKRLK